MLPKLVHGTCMAQQVPLHSHPGLYEALFGWRDVRQLCKKIPQDSPPHFAILLEALIAQTRFRPVLPPALCAQLRSSGI
jgi:hypothetical protein